MPLCSSVSDYAGTVLRSRFFRRKKRLKEKRAEKLQSLEDRFFAAQKEGKTIKGCIVEGNSLFNGTTEPQKKPYGKPYTEAELKNARRSAERNSKVFLLAQDGTLYYPTVKKGRGRFREPRGIPVRAGSDRSAEENQNIYLGNPGAHGGQGD